jgi:hypothetical protein
MTAAATQAGDLDRAEALARTLTNPDAQAQALNDMATAAAQSGDLNRAERLLADTMMTNSDTLSWVMTTCEFFPLSIGNTLDILASAYAIRA